MGRTYEILCHDCKVTLWIGQSIAGRQKPYLYSTNGYTEKLEVFLFAHQNHRLEFGDDEAFHALDYESLDRDADDG